MRGRDNIRLIRSTKLQSRQYYRRIRSGNKRRNITSYELNNYRYKKKKNVFYMRLVPWDDIILRLYIRGNYTLPVPSLMHRFIAKVIYGAKNGSSSTPLLPVIHVSDK